MQLKTREEINLMRASAAILSRVHGEIAKAIAPGITTAALDYIAKSYIKAAGATPSFEQVKGYPATICTSVNYEVVHVLPSQYRLKEGDIVAIDCGVYYQGFHADAAFTHGVGKIATELLHLLATTEKALYKGIAEMRVGKRIGDISHAIQRCVEGENLSVVEGFTGHGIGRHLHEGPEVPNVGKPESGLRIREGMTLAIEPIVNMGKSAVVSPRKWYVESKDKKPSAHFEHTVAVVNGCAEVLTTFDFIKEAKKLYA